MAIPLVGRVIDMLTRAGPFALRIFFRNLCPKINNGKLILIYRIHVDAEDFAIVFLSEK